MALWVCRKCTTKFAVGLPYCPQCTSTDVQEDTNMPKITVHDGPSNAEEESWDGSNSSTSTEKPATPPVKKAAAKRARTTGNRSSKDPTDGSTARSTAGPKGK